MTIESTGNVGGNTEASTVEETNRAKKSPNGSDWDAFVELALICYANRDGLCIHFCVCSDSTSLPVTFGLMESLGLLAGSRDQQSTRCRFPGPHDVDADDIITNEASETKNTRRRRSSRELWGLLICLLVLGLGGCSSIPLCCSASLRHDV
ncbi:hypothetical protein GQ600_16786 [Phytophthora cactorum]|nr:hypothetical protein GQ600_16786 [Phytophthora cactorum]